MGEGHERALSLVGAFPFNKVRLCQGGSGTERVQHDRVLHRETRIGEGALHKRHIVCPRIHAVGTLCNYSGTGTRVQ